MTRRMSKVLFALVALSAVVLSSCGRLAEDEQELRAFIRSSEQGPRAFTYTEAARDRWFSLSGRVADDLRFAFTLASPQGPVAAISIVDDALAVRLLQPELLRPHAAKLGHPDTVEALLAGSWVLDPAGAPPLAPVKSQEQVREAPDPFEIGVRIFHSLTAGMGQASRIREFNLEDIEYKPSQDPWIYPNEDRGQVRYDLWRPTLPVREEQMQQGQVTIGEAHFRKTSAFVVDGRIARVCEMVDVEGHEEFLKLRNGEVNPFLETVRQAVLEGRTETPVRPRTVLMTLSYPETVEVSMPANAVRARLDTFLGGLRQAFKDGLIAPPGPIPGECLRTEDPATRG